MKKILVVLLSISLVACSGKLDESKAKAVVEDLIQKVDKGDYEGARKLYSEDFASSETSEVRADKFKQLKEVFGEVQSMEMTEAVENAEGDQAAMTLTYKIKHSKRTSVEKFVVVLEEGEYKIARQAVEAGN
jgi:hypothetical protein